MPYPGQFVKLVLIGNLYTDVFNTTLSIVPNALGELGMPEVNEATLDAVAAAVRNWYVGGIAGDDPLISVHAHLTSIKLNRIGVDGRYVDPETREHVYTTFTQGNAGIAAPAQLSAVATLRTAVPRGRASKGRMYLPPTQMCGAIDVDGRASAAAATAQAESVRALIDAVNDQYIGIGRVGVASNAGAGRFEHVTSVSVGRVIDTMRSRRSTQPEDYQTVVL